MGTKRGLYRADAAVRLGCRPDGVVVGPMWLMATIEQPIATGVSNTVANAATWKWRPVRERSRKAKRDGRNGRSP